MSAAPSPSSGGLASVKLHLEYLQSCVRTRLESAVGAARAADAFGLAAEADSTAFNWPPVDLQLRPALAQLARGRGGVERLAAARAAVGTSGGNSAASQRPTGDLISHDAIKLANAWRAHLRAKEKAAAAATTASTGDVTSESGSASASSAAAFDLDAAIARWSSLLRDRFLDELSRDPCVPLARMRVETHRGFINFIFDEAVLRDALDDRTAAGEPSPASSVSSASASPAPVANAPVPMSSLVLNAGPAASATSTDLSHASAFAFASLGTLRSVFCEKHGTPRQGAVAPSARARLTLAPHLDASCLEGLSEYSHVWVVFIFHHNTVPSAFTAAKIAPPRLHGKKVGLFATRSPHRPNPIGLSLARLDKVTGSTVHLSGIDLVNGTPVIDLKPYHPADCMPQYKIPSWLDTLPTHMLRVEWTTDAEQQLRAACESEAGLEFYEASEIHLVRDLVESVLSQDPRSTHSRERHSHGIYGLAVDRIDVCFRMEGEEEAAAATQNGGDSTAAAAAAAAPTAGASDPSSPSAATAAAPLPSAVIFAVKYHAPGSVRTRMRTKEWLAGIQADIAASEAKKNSSTNDAAPATNGAETMAE